MFKKLTDAALSLKERADVGEKLEATKQFASSKYEAWNTGASAAWEKHWPTIEGVAPFYRRGEAAGRQNA